MPDPDFDVDPETIRVFPMGEEYWFSHYVDRQDLFRQLNEYYNDDAYRFESPAEALQAGPRKPRRRVHRTRRR